MDWSMIPLHIRLTRRDKIDPNYPIGNDAKWWQYEEKKTRTDGPGASNSGQSDRQQSMLALIKEKGEIMQRDIAERFGYRCELSKHIINGLSHAYPIYEGNRDGLSYYGMLKDSDTISTGVN